MYKVFYSNAAAELNVRRKGRWEIGGRLWCRVRLSREKIGDAKGLPYISSLR